jgi:hypothetical protein
MFWASVLDPLQPKQNIVKAEIGVGISQAKVASESSQVKDKSSAVLN